jgi:hypothetical protein
MGCFLFWLEVGIMDIAIDFSRAGYSWRLLTDEKHTLVNLPLFLIFVVPLFAVVLAFIHLFYILFPVGFMSQLLLRKKGGTDLAARNLSGSEYSSRITGSLK